MQPCSKCGYVPVDGDKFCKKCGTPLAKPEPEVVEPVMEEPAVVEPVVEEPVVEEPVVVEPVVEEPVAVEPVVEEPVVEEPAVVEPVVEKPVVEEPAVVEPVVEEPVAVEPVVEAPAMPQPVKIQPVKANIAKPQPVNAEPAPSKADDRLFTVQEAENYVEKYYNRNYAPRPGSAGYVVNRSATQCSANSCLVTVAASYNRPGYTTELVPVAQVTLDMTSAQVTIQPLAAPTYAAPAYTAPVYTAPTYAPPTYAAPGYGAYAPKLSEPEKKFSGGRKVCTVILSLLTLLAWLVFPLIDIPYTYISGNGADLLSIAERLLNYMDGENLVYFLWVAIPPLFLLICFILGLCNCPTGVRVLCILGCVVLLMPVLFLLIEYGEDIMDICGIGLLIVPAMMITTAAISSGD